MPNWTNEQLCAINSFGNPTIVSAAAGSGKTAVLVERTIRLLSDHEKNIPADSVLAVTFTNDAASQMREKLSNAFESLAISDPSNAWVQHQQALLHLAQITTINSFCFGLVKDNLALTDFQTGLRILEQNESDMLTDRALTDVLERRYAHDGEEMEKLISLFCKENDYELRAVIKKLYAFLRTLPYQELWISDVIKSHRDGSKLGEIMTEFRTSAKSAAATVKSLSSKLADLCQSLEYHSADKAAFIKNCDLADSLCDAVENSEWDGLVGTFAKIPWARRTGKTTAAEKAACSYAEEAYYRSAVLALDELKASAEQMGDYFKYPVSVMQSDSLLCADIFENLCEICRELEDAVHKVKVEKNAVDFADTELMTVRLLTNIDQNGKITRTPLCEEIVSSKRYKLIIIDEFQDVNNLQDVIFKAISDTDDLNLIGNNVFVVGDAKQAIYRFRRANPMIFVNTRLAAADDNNLVSEVILSRNFRSRNAVLGFANYIFSSLMSREVGEIDYTFEEELRLGANYEGKDPAAELILVNSDAVSDDDEGIVPDEFSAVASKIKEMLDEGVSVRDGDDYRPCIPSDFCVLTRNNITDESLVSNFRRLGLKVLSNDRSGYLASREISVLLNLLSCIASPMRDVPMASVMLSPIMGFTDDELALVKMAGKKHRLYKNMLRIIAGEREASDILKAKCESAVTLLKKLRIYAAEMPLTRLIQKAYDLTDIFSIASAYEDGSQKRANLHLLLEYAASYEEASSDGIAGFLRYIDYISKSGGDFESAYAVTESADAVSVKTIHKSKGLEYPFVFICQTKKKFNRRDLQGALNLNADAGVGINFLDKSQLVKHKTVFADHIRLKNESEMLSEELRLLYVALTRAKERVFVVLNTSEKSLERAAKFAYSIDTYKVPSDIAKKADSFEDWLYMALLRHPALEHIRKDLLPEDLAYCDGDFISFPDVVASHARIMSDAVGEKSDLSESAPADREMVMSLMSNFSLEYDRRLIENEAKVTVSELVKDDALDFFVTLPELGESLGELTPAQKGTVTHRFMQFCNFNNASRDLETEISRLESGGLFTKREADAIDRRAVGEFFKGEIYSRMLQSREVMRERSFIVRFDDIDIPADLAIMYKDTDGMLQGIADCLFEESDGYVLVDYKTDRVKSETELIDRYRGQLSLYKSAFGAILDKPIKSAYIYSFCLARGIEIEL